MMITPALPAAAWLAFAMIVLSAALCDMKARLIPNALTVALPAIFLAEMVITERSHEIAMVHIAFGLAVLVAGFALFSANIMGGGDAKLIAGVAVWTGTNDFMSFLAVTTMAGGVLALLVMCTGSTPDRTSTKTLPYGAAVAAGALFIAWQKVAATA